MLARSPYDDNDDPDRDPRARLRGCAAIIVISIMFWIVIGLVVVYFWPWN